MNSLNIDVSMEVCKAFTYFVLFVACIISTSCKSLRDTQTQSYAYNQNECIKEFKKHNYCTLYAYYYDDYRLTENIERFVVSVDLKNMPENEIIFIVSNLNRQLIKKGYKPLKNETLTILSSHCTGGDNRGLITLSGNSNLVIGYTERDDLYPVHIDSDEGFTFINWEALKFWYRYYVFSDITFCGVNDLKKEIIANDYFKYTQMLLKGDENEQYQTLTRPRILTTDDDFALRLTVAKLKNGAPVKLHSYIFLPHFYCYSVW